MIAIGRDQIIFPFFKHGRHANGNRFLSAIKMTESADPLPRAGVFLIGPFLKSADKQHAAKEFPLFDAIRCACHRLRMSLFGTVQHNSHNSSVLNQ